MNLPPGRTRFGRAFRLALLLSAGGAVGAGAQTPPEPATRLPEMAVQARPSEISGPRSSAFVVDDLLLAGRSRVTLSDALRGVPGVLTQDHFGGFEPARISLRGSGLQSAPLSRGLNFLLDGMPLNLADGSFNGALVDPALADHVEVSRAPAGFGDAAGVLGGAVELHAPSRSMNALLASAFGGSAGLLGGTASVRAARQDLATEATVDLSRQDGYRDHAAQSRSGLWLQARTPAPAGADSAFSVYHVHAAYDVPGPLTLAAAASAPRSVSSDVIRDQPRRVAEGTRLALQTRQQNADLAVRAGASWLHSTDWFRQLAANGLSDSRSDDLALRAGMVRRLDTALGMHRLEFNTGYDRGWREVRRYANDRAATGRQFGDDRLSATTFTAEIADEIEPAPTVSVRVGLAGLAVRRDIDDRWPATVAGLTTQPYSASSLQPRAALFWTPARDVHVHGGVSRGSEPPTFDDLLVVSGTAPNLQRRAQRLAVQTATTWEVGAAGRRGPVEWDVTAYTAEWANEILRLADARGLPRGAVNATATRHDGVDAWARWTLVDGANRLRCVATASWSRFTFVDDPVFGGNRLAGLPPHQGAAELQYDRARGLFAAAGADWTAGATRVDHAGRMSYGGHVIATVRAGWAGARGWRVSAEMRNVFDREYIAGTAGVLDIARNPAATSVFLPGVGRTVILRLEWRYP
jgi:iron complex outermembrane receptor protein